MGRAEDTGYWERSQRFYQQDYGRALKMLNDWINRGEPQDLLDRPTFKEVREGHLVAMKQLGIYPRYSVEFFFRDKDKQRAKWRAYKQQDPYIPDHLRDKKLEWVAPTPELYMLMVDSLACRVCFGCGLVLGSEPWGIIKRWKGNDLDQKYQVAVHNNSGCKQSAMKNLKAGFYKSLV